MTRLDIKRILVAPSENLSAKPCVLISDRVTKAIEAMLKNDVTRIAVIQGGKLVGMIRLEDALEQVGLKGHPETKRRAGVAAGRTKNMQDK